jgi:outer membrane protein assembly factor BamA
MLKNLLAILLLLGGVLRTFAQVVPPVSPSSPKGQVYPLTVVAASKDSASAGVPPGLQQTFPDRIACYRYVNGLATLLQAQGYIAASVDSTEFTKTGARIVLYVGHKYRWGNLVDRIDPVILEQLHFDDNKAWRRPIQWKVLAGLEAGAIEYCTQHGYPFARVGLDSVRIDGDEVDAVIRLDKGFLYRIDSIRVFGNVKVNKDFLYRYLDIPPGAPYDQNKLNTVSSRILALSYVQEDKPWSLRMTGTGAVLDLYLKPKRNNQIDGMLGLLPTTQADGSSKTQVVGELKLQLQNAFGNGEALSVNWQQLQPQTPRLDLSFQQPYLFESPVGISTTFDLLKKDSSYLNINFKLGGTLSFSNQRTLTLFLQLFGSSLLNVDTNTVRATHQLPDVLDMGATYLGVGYDWRNTDYAYNPRKGNELSLVFLGGLRHIKENTAITQLQDSNFNFASLYDTVPLRSVQFKAQLGIAHYFPLGRLSTLRTAFNGGWQFSPQLYTNELFQIGGYKLLRGFDEESIYASQYLEGSLEYRILIGQNSYFFGFTDGAWVRNQSVGSDLNATLVGVGFGINLETKAGMFNISFAEGEGNGENFNFGNTKVHIGYVNFF